MKEIDQTNIAAEMIRIIIAIKVSLETATKEWFISKKCHTISFEFPNSQLNWLTHFLLMLSIPPEKWV